MERGQSEPVRALRRSFQDAMGSGRALPLNGRGGLSRVAREGTAVRIHGGDLISPEARALADESGLSEAVVAPVRVGGQLWGGVVAATGRAGALGAGAEERLSDFAKLVGPGIENAAARGDLERRATTDPLTGLANHRAFHDRMAEEIARAPPPPAEPDAARPGPLQARQRRARPRDGRRRARAVR